MRAILVFPLLFLQYYYWTNCNQGPVGGERNSVFGIGWRAVKGSPKDLASGFTQPLQDVKRLLLGDYTFVVTPLCHYTFVSAAKLPSPHPPSHAMISIHPYLCPKGKNANLWNTQTMTLKVIVETCFNWAGFQKGSRRYLANLFALCLQPRGWRGGAHGDSAPRRVFLSCRSPAAPRLAGGRAPVRMLGGLGRRAGGESVLAVRPGAAVAAATAPGTALRVLAPLLWGRHLGRLWAGPYLSMLPDLGLRSRPGGSCDGGGRGGCGER